MRHNIRLAVAIVVVLGALTQPRSLAADLRTWSDASGNFTLKAKFVGVADGKVTLQQEDGSSIEIELAKLSDADQKYVAEQKAAAENPFKKKNDNPFQPKAKTDASAEPGLTAVDWSGVKIIDINPASGTWKLPPSAGPGGDLKPQIIRLPAKTDFFEKVNGLTVSVVANRAVVGYSTNKPGQNTGGTTRLAFVDLAAGKLIAAVNVPGLFAPIALADDGNRVLVRRDEFGGDKMDRLELWALDGSAIRKIAQWIPYDDVKGNDREVKWAAFLADGRLATCSGGGRLAVWDLEPLRPAYQLTIKGGGIPALSPDRKLIAFAEEKEVGVLDAATGQVLVTREMPTTPWPALAFSPDGKRLACVGFDKLYVWDAATGDVQREMPFQGVHVAGKVAWADADHVLVGGTTLLDLERQIRLWDYHGGEPATSAGGLCWFVANEGERAPGGLVGVKLPQETVLARLAKAMAEPDFFVLKPGKTVAIDVTGLADSDRQDAVAAALKAKLEADGFQVGAAGTITLKATTEQGKEREVSCRMFGTPPWGSKKYKVKEFTSKVQFVYQGKPAWQASVNNIPFFVHLDQDETIEQYLKKHEKSNYDWFEKVQLPKLLTKPTSGSPGLGMSRVTPAGLR
jgi:WD40 repeat protein